MFLFHSKTCGEGLFLKLVMGCSAYLTWDSAPRLSKKTTDSVIYNIYLLIQLRTTRGRSWIQSIKSIQAGIEREDI